MMISVYCDLISQQINFKMFYRNECPVNVVTSRVCKDSHSFQSHSKQRRGTMLSFGVLNNNLDTYIYDVVDRDCVLKRITENSRPENDGVGGTGPRSSLNRM